MPLVTITIELGHETNDDGTVNVKNSCDEIIANNDSAEDVEFLLRDVIEDALSSNDLEAATISVDWSK